MGRNSMHGPSSVSYCPLRRSCSLHSSFHFLSRCEPTSHLDLVYLSSTCRPLFFYFMLSPVRELSVSAYRPDDATCIRQIQNAMLNLIPLQPETFILAGCVTSKSIRFQSRKLKVIQRGRARDNKVTGSATDVDLNIKLVFKFVGGPAR